MKTLKLFTICFLFILFILHTPATTLAGGFDNSGIGVRGQSMGSSIVAVVNEASAVYYNPGGIAFNKAGQLHAEFYTYGIAMNFEYSNAGNNNISRPITFIPGFFISKTFEKLSIGYGVYIPYGGGGTEYENFMDTGFDLEYAAGFIAFNPIVAYRINDRLSVGLGVAAYWGIMESKIANSDYTGHTIGEYDGIAGYGANFGVMYKPDNKYSFGLSVRSKIPLKMDGTIKTHGTTSDAEVSFDMPYYFSIGAGYQFNDKLTLTFSATRMLWSDMDKITFTVNDVSEGSPTNNTDNWLIGTGLEYKFTQKTTLWGGVKFSEGAADDEDLVPVSNDVNTITSAFGMAYKLTDTIELAMTTMLDLGFETSSGNQTFDHDHYVLVIGLRYNK